MPWADWLQWGREDDVAASHRGYIPAGWGGDCDTHYLFALPLLLLQTAAIGLGVGLWMSSLTAKYRDFAHLTGFLTQLWMYATPVVYPLKRANIAQKIDRIIGFYLCSTGESCSCIL